MNISEVLASVQKPASQNFGVVIFNGVILPDTHAGFFRVYPQGIDKGRYFILRTEDVVDELHKWTEAELAHSRFIGQERYRIPIRYGAIVHKVKVITFAAGQAPRKSSKPAVPCDGNLCESDDECDGLGCECVPVEHYAECLLPA